MTERLCFVLDLFGFIENVLYLFFICMLLPDAEYTDKILK